MNTLTSAHLDRDACLRALSEFWNAETRIEETREGFAVALPLLYPDGLQVLVYIEALTPHAVRLSDKGRTLGNLAELGLNWDRNARHNQTLLNDRIQAFELTVDGFDLSSTVAFPLKGLDLHLFGEALVSIAHLAYRVEAVQPVASAAAATVRRLLETRKLPFQEQAVLSGKLERGIRVDYLIQNKRSLAIEVVKRRGPMLPYMEQWGWRWMDVRNGNPDMIRAMIYDPDKQDWDDTALSIGQSVCDIFCPYYEAQTFERALDQVA